MIQGRIKDGSKREKNWEIMQWSFRSVPGFSNRQSTDMCEANIGKILCIKQKG